MIQVSCKYYIINEISNILSAKKDTKILNFWFYEFWLHENEISFYNYEIKIGMNFIYRLT